MTGPRLFQNGRWVISYIVIFYVNQKFKHHTVLRVLIKDPMNKNDKRFSLKLKYGLTVHE
jgi:hypothetical protein